MIEIGKYNKLKAVKTSADGVYLDAGNYGELLLPTAEVPDNYNAGDSLKVFLYRESETQIIPTTKKPHAILGEFACLKVLDVLPIGSFLDWGLPKDLFVPLSEQQEAMKEGVSYVVYIYKDDRHDRLAASSKLNAFLDQKPVAFKENEKVDLVICNQTELGYNAIVNHSHWGLLYKNEAFQTLEYGQKVQGFIKKIRADKRIDLSLHIQGYQKMDDLEEKIIAEINRVGGIFTVTDKSSPEIIYELFGVSKKKYKMALGSLYKLKRIIIEDDIIKIQ
ncbi:MAG: S1-like domain-containing RNA-binding protein [Candidatus Omnitrophica bacterium]|nr:S1-like domain-containing RNA-binding protein [Candidatus Omnitrophota bacterium]